MFSLDTAVTTKVLDTRILAKKDRGPDDLPGVQLLLRATVSADVLSLFDGFLKGMLYRKATKKQGELDGIESNELTGIGEHVKRLRWAYEQTGSEVTIHRGTADPRSAIVLPDCLLHRFLFAPKPGGSVEMQWTIDAPAVSVENRGTLTGLKATEIDITIAEPEVAEDPQTEIAGTEKPRGRRRDVAATSQSRSLQ